MKRKVLCFIIVFALTAGLGLLPTNVSADGPTVITYLNAETLKTIPNLEFKSDKQFVFERPDGTSFTAKGDYYEPDYSEFYMNYAIYGDDGWWSADSLVNQSGKYILKQYPVPIGYEIVEIYSYAWNESGVRVKESDGFFIEVFSYPDRLSSPPDITILVRETGSVPISSHKVGDALGDVLYSDITAYINGHAIPTSVINGKTLVVVEDLAKYGFDIVWNGAAKTLKVELNKGKKFNPIDTKKDTSNKPGTFKEKYVYTDIKTYISGEEVECYAIKGVTLIDFDALGKFGKFAWDGKAREIKLTID